MPVTRENVQLVHEIKDAEYRLLRAITILNPVKNISKECEAYLSYYNIMEQHHELENTLHSIGLTFPPIQHEHKIEILHKLQKDADDLKFNATTFMNSIIIPSL